MKTTKLLCLLFIGTLLLNCSKDDTNEAVLSQPTFTVTVSPDDSSIYFFENTTPNKGEFYNYWEFDIGLPKVADAPGQVMYQYQSSGSKIVTLTMVSASTGLQSSQSVNVMLPPPPPVTSFLINPENLLKNGYFTEGDGNDFTNWGKFNGADRITAQNTQVLVGSRAVKVENPEAGEAYFTQLVSDAFATTSGQAYTASMWLKGTATVRFSTNAGLGGEQYAGNYNATADWTQYSWTFTANGASTTLALDMGAASGVFFVDAVEVVPGNIALPLPTNDSALLNGDFENGAGDDFTNWNKFNGADRITNETVDVLSGARAVRINNPEAGEAYFTQLVSDAFATTSGQNYTVSMWIKGAGKVVRYSTNAGLGGEQYAGNYTATAEWTKYSWSFAANSATTTIALDMGASSGTFVIDRVKVVAN